MDVSSAYFIIGILLNRVAQSFSAGVIIHKYTFIRELYDGT